MKRRLEDEHFAEVTEEVARATPIEMPLPIESKMVKVNSEK